MVDKKKQLDELFNSSTQKKTKVFPLWVLAFAAFAAVAIVGILAFSGNNVNASIHNSTIIGGDQNIQHNNIVVAHADGAQTVLWGDLSAKSRKKYRGMVFAYFPQTVRSDRKINW